MSLLIQRGHKRTTNARCCTDNLILISDESIIFLYKMDCGGSLGSGPPPVDAAVSRTIKTTSYLNLDTDSLSGSGSGSVAHPQALLL